MTIRESIRSQWEIIKNKSVKEKVAYFWDYYGFKTIAILVVAAFIIFFASEVVTQKEYAYTAIFFGAEAQSSAGTYLEEFAHTENIDTEEYNITIECPPSIRLDGPVSEDLYQTIASFTALVETNMVENFAAETDLFLYYSYLGYTADLRTHLTPEQLADLAPYLIYMDAGLIAKQENIGEAPTIDYRNFPDPRNPSLMTDPVPVAIDLSFASERFRSAYQFIGNSVVLGICSTTEKAETATAFIRYVFELE